MANWRYIRLYWDDHGVTLSGADKRLVNDLALQIQEEIPSVKLFPIDGFPSSKPAGWKLTDLQKKDRRVGPWVLQQLCLHGWEPFACTNSVYQGTSSNSTFHLRKCEETSQP